MDVSEFLAYDKSPTLDLEEWQREWGVDGDKRGGVTKPEVDKARREIHLMQRKTSHIGRGLNKTTGWVHRASIKAKGVNQWTGVTYDKIDDAGLHITHQGESKVLDVDTIVLCTGQESVRTLFDQVQAAGIEARIVGGADVAAELDAKRAIRQATEAVAALEPQDGAPTPESLPWHLKLQKELTARAMG